MAASAWRKCFCVTAVCKVKLLTLGSAHNYDGDVLTDELAQIHRCVCLFLCRAHSSAVCVSFLCACVHFPSHSHLRSIMCTCISSPGFLTSVLSGQRETDQQIIKEFEASHGTVTDMWAAHQRGEETSL